MDLWNECEDDSLPHLLPVADAPPLQAVPQNDGNEIECNAESDDSNDKCKYTLIDEDENVDKPKRDGKEIVCDVKSGDNKGKWEYKLIDGYEDVETPKKGMVFDSLEELTLYYRRVGSKGGFGVVQKKAYKDGDKRVIRVTLACARQGKLRPKTNKPNPTTKTDCKANLNATLVGTKWYVTTFNTEHNHDLSPSKARYFKCNRILNPSVKRQIIINDIAGIRPSQSYSSLAVEAGGYEHLSFVEKDCRNFLNKARHLRLGQGGAEALRDYFTKMQSRNNGFYSVLVLRCWK